METRPLRVLLMANLAVFLLVCALTVTSAPAIPLLGLKAQR